MLKSGPTQPTCVHADAAMDAQNPPPSNPKSRGRQGQTSGVFGRLQETRWIAGLEVKTASVYLDQSHYSSDAIHSQVLSSLIRTTFFQFSAIGGRREFRQERSANSRVPMLNGRCRAWLGRAIRRDNASLRVPPASRTPSPKPSCRPPIAAGAARDQWRELLATRAGHGHNTHVWIGRSQRQIFLVERVVLCPIVRQKPFVGS